MQPLGVFSAAEAVAAESRSVIWAAGLAAIGHLIWRRDIAIGCIEGE